MLPYLHLGVTMALVGLIWTIQLVHYPTFHFVADSDFPNFHQHHTQSITLVVMPLMLAELGLATYLSYQAGWHWQQLIPLIFVLLIWASTFLISVPLHDSLTAGKNTQTIQQLVNTNWIRTILWTVEAAWLFYFTRLLA